MNKSVIIVFIIASLLLLGGGIVLATRSTAPVITGLDDFAKCLTSKNVVMYGAAWCSHCQREKKAFGVSFKYVSYFECPADPQKCLDKGVESYPTWILDDGTKLVGEQGIKKLSEATGCGLP